MSAHGVLAVFGLELPTAWAREHERLAVELEQTEDFGLHATLVGDDGERLLGFPWHDHVDRLLVVEGGRELPVELADGGWDDLEQGWWGSVIAAGHDVYLAETDFDALHGADDRTLALVRPGLVRAGHVEILWNRAGRAAYDGAWCRAIHALRGPTGLR